MDTPTPDAPTETPDAPEAEVEVHTLSRKATSVQRKAAPDQGTPEPSSALDPFSEFYASGRVLEPPYSPDALIRYAESSNILPQCITALSRNIVGHGYTMQPTFDKASEEAQEILDLAAEEKQRAIRFFDGANLEMTFDELMDAVERDIETVGWCGLELQRTKAGALAGLTHIRGKDLRLGAREAESIEVTRWRLTTDGSEWVEEVGWIRPRCYVQRGRARQVWFKMPGDPRRISRASGRPIAGNDDSQEEARELLWLDGPYNPGSPYPLPRWAGVIPEVLGSHKQALTNVSYFDDGAIPPMIIAMSGGQFTKKALDRFAEQMEAIKGATGKHRVLLIEAMTKGSGMAADLQGFGSNQIPRLDVIDLRENMASDALFQGYDDNCRRKIRSACGVPPIAIGESDDYTRATAREATRVWDQNVLSPSRNKIADRIQRFIMSELRVLYWRFAFNGPPLTGAEEVAEVMTAAAEAGVGSPNVWARVINHYFGIEIPVEDDAWADLPFTLVRLAVQAGALSFEKADDDTITITPGAEADADAFVEEVERHVQRAISHRAVAPVAA